MNLTALQLELPAGAVYVIEVATRVPPSALRSAAATVRLEMPPLHVPSSALHSLAATPRVEMPISGECFLFW